MSTMVCNRGKRSTTEILTQLNNEIEEHIKNGTSTYPVEEKYRIFWDGIACWPYLGHNLRVLKQYGINMVASGYVKAWALDYETGDLDGMAKAYYKAPNSVCIEQGVAWREGICRDNKVDGVLVHYNRSCKPWSGYMAEMQRRFTADLGVPCAGFDGDQADPRNFNEAQYETRVQGLVEAMAENKKAKEAQA
jgi:benzoyl-CoA reductase/2-hydroxyglutaryl-CoA dehydratase subunit BcrC/BadD/HgdB